MLNKFNRFLIAMIIGFVIYLVAGSILILLNWNSLLRDQGAVLDSLATNFLSNALFFGLVGAAGVLAQFYGEHGDVLKQRLRKVFVNENVGLPVIDYFEEIARNNAVPWNATGSLISRIHKPAPSQT